MTSANDDDYVARRKRSIFYDFETTGFASGKKALDDPGQPHIVQAAIVVVDNEDEVCSFVLTARPDGWEIPDDVAQVHGIDQEQAVACGVPEPLIVEAFAILMARPDTTMIAHNEWFDRMILKIALKRFADPTVIVALGETTAFCTMKAAREPCQLPKKNGGIRNPSLTDAYKALFGEDLEGAHSAMIDVRACQRIYTHLQGL